MKDYKETLMLIKFVDGTAKKWLEDRYRMELDKEQGVVRVYNQVTGNLDFEGYLQHVMYIQYHITKRTPNRSYNNRTYKQDKYEPDTGAVVNVGDEVDMDEIQAEFAEEEDV